MIFSPLSIEHLIYGSGLPVQVKMGMLVFPLHNVMSDTQPRLLKLWKDVSTNCMKPWLFSRVLNVMGHHQGNIRTTRHNRLRKKTYNRVACSESENKRHGNSSPTNFKTFKSIFKRVCTDWLLQVCSQYKCSSRLSELMQTGFVYASHFLNWFAGSFEDIYHPEIIHTVCIRANR